MFSCSSAVVNLLLVLHQIVAWYQNM